jgi:diguanylate cyclase (GGDEF)-like protein
LPDKQTNAFSASNGAAAPRPVAVTRWTARLADPACEQDYRVSRFQDDRRRILLLMVLVASAGFLIFLGRLYAHLYYGDTREWLYPPLASVAISLFAMLVFSRMTTPRALEIAVLATGVLGTTTRLTMLTLQPALLAMWLPLMVTTIFVVYLYLPIRFVFSFGLATAFSIVTPIWWSLVAHPVMPGPEVYRGILWLLLANALGFTAANALHRTQRMAFAQSLLLQQLLSTDSLTGIANRRRFDDAFEREWRRCRRAGAPLSLLMIDVDHFKPYNDLYGHQQGDDCLRQVAQLLLEEMGRPGDLLARYGGEEFVCLLPEAGPFGARTVANRLVAKIRRADITHPLSPASEQLTISIGVATASDLSGSPDALVALADKMLYAAKDAGRDQVMGGMLPRNASTPVAA